MGNHSQLEAECPEAEYEFGVVADLDLNSRDPQEFIWSLSCLKLSARSLNFQRAWLHLGVRTSRTLTACRHCTWERYERWSPNLAIW